MILLFSPHFSNELPSDPGWGTSTFLNEAPKDREGGGREMLTTRCCLRQKQQQAAPWVPRCGRRLPSTVCWHCVPQHLWSSCSLHLYGQCWRMPLKLLVLTSLSCVKQKYTLNGSTQAFPSSLSYPGPNRVLVELQPLKHTKSNSSREFW